MRILSLLGLSLVAILFAACSSSATSIRANPTSPGQTQSALHHGIGPNGVPPHVSAIRGWLASPDRHHHHKKKLLYVSDEGDGVIDVFALPSLSLIGQITTGISQAEGIATGKHGNLYVSNLGNGTVTVYH